jgi:rod shape-determining protein MreD
VIFSLSSKIMWKKILATTLLFYVFALLQRSFFAQLNIFGAIPDLVFILFFLTAFFAEKDNNYQIIFLAITAGFFSDVFLYAYLGPSIVLFVIIGILLKKIQSSLKNRDDKYPFAYFLPLFIIFFLAYYLALSLSIYFMDFNKVVFGFDLGIIYQLVYNLLVASALFYIYKRWLKSTR